MRPSNQRYVNERLSGPTPAEAFSFALGRVLRAFEACFVCAVVLSGCSCASMRPASGGGRIDRVAKKLESKRGLAVTGFTDLRGTYHELDASVWVEGDSLIFISESKPMFKLEGPASISRFAIPSDSVRALHAEELTPGWMALKILRISLLSLVLVVLLRIGVWGVFGT